jgi:hypothetical protein
MFMRKKPIRIGQTVRIEKLESASADLPSGLASSAHVKSLAFGHGFVEEYLVDGKRWLDRKSSARLGGKAVGEKTARQALGCGLPLHNLE